MTNATHDLTPKTWGHDYAFTSLDNGMTGRVTAWYFNPIEPGDYVILRNGEDATRYQVKRVRRPGDPKDMMFLDVVFSPRTEQEKYG